MNYTRLVLSSKSTLLYNLLMKLLADQSIPHLERFAALFSVTRYANLAELHTLLPEHDVLLCRANLKVTAELLQFAKLQCVATASSGIDHIDDVYLRQQGIQLLSAAGCNAHAVSDYVLACLAYLIEHQHLQPGPIGIIGCGQVGGLLARRLHALKFQLRLYDPPKSMREANFKSCQLADLTACSAILIHANLHATPPYPTTQLLNAAFFNQLPPGCVVLNAARGEIVDEQALLAVEKPLLYCTDVYVNEPEVSEAIIARATLCTPHIAGHSLEGKANASIELFNQLCAYYAPSHPRVARATPQRLSRNGSWTKTMLDYYNPETESLLLKQAPNKKTAFLNLRTAHPPRHDVLIPTHPVAHE